MFSDVNWNEADPEPDALSVCTLPLHYGPRQEISEMKWHRLTVTGQQITNIWCLQGFFCLSKYRHGHTCSVQGSIRTPYQERSVISLAGLSPSHIPHNDM